MNLKATSPAGRYGPDIIREVKEYVMEIASAHAKAAVEGALETLIKSADQKASITVTINLSENYTSKGEPALFLGEDTKTSGKIQLKSPPTMKRFQLNTRALPGLEG